MKNKVVVMMLAMVILVVSFTGCTKKEVVKDEKQPIGIISAMDAEVEYLLSIAKETSTEEVGGVTYHIGQLEGKDVVICKAGIGKSLSASGTAILIEKYNVSKIIFTGIAGAVADELSIADVVISDELMFHDYGYMTDEGIQINSEFLEEVRVKADEELVKLAEKTAKEVCKDSNNVVIGLIATGDQFCASAKEVERLNSLGAKCVEMEGCSVGYVANQFNVPFVVIRGMSDKADGIAHETYDKWWEVVADNSGKIVQKMIKSM